MNFKTNDVQIIKLDDCSVWIKHVHERLYVINGYYVYFATNIDDVPDDFLADLFYRSAQLFLQTFSADNGDICFVYKDIRSTGESCYTFDRRDVSIFEADVMHKLRRILNEYRSWPGD
jgi:hypothetical protein